MSQLGITTVKERKKERKKKKKNMWKSKALKYGYHENRNKKTVTLTSKQ